MCQVQAHTCPVPSCQVQAHTHLCPTLLLPQEEWVHNVKVDKNETKVEYRALRAQWAILTEQRVAATQGARALRAWAARNARPARKVRLTAPNLVVLKQVSCL